MKILRAPELAFSGHLYPRIDCANFAGIVNRIRCQITCSAFSETTPSVYWGSNWSGEKTDSYATEVEAKRVFSSPLLPAEGLNRSVGPTYNDWIVLTPEIIGEKRATAALCIDALNVDGLKSAEMLYQLPDPIYYSLQAHLLGIFSKEYMARIHRLIAICRLINYAVISFRFWSECVPAFKVGSFINRVDANWITPEHFSDMCDSLMGSKWPRLRPSVAALHSARELLQTNGIENIIFMSDRWNGASFCTGSTHAIRDAVLDIFAAGLERQIANLFVIANSSHFWRSKDSTFTHLPILLSAKWSVRIVDT